VCHNGAFLIHQFWLQLLALSRRESRNQVLALSRRESRNQLWKRRRRVACHPCVQCGHLHYKTGGLHHSIMVVCTLPTWSSALLFWWPALFCLVLIKQSWQRRVTQAAVASGTDKWLCGCGAGVACLRCGAGVACSWVWCGCCLLVGVVRVLLACGCGAGVACLWVLLAAERKVLGIPDTVLTDPIPADEIRAWAAEGR
jgi:hypothetical protein